MLQLVCASTTSTHRSSCCGFFYGFLQSGGLVLSALTIARSKDSIFACGVPPQVPCGNQFELLGRQIYLAVSNRCPVDFDGRSRTLDPAGKRKNPAPESSAIVHRLALA